MIMTAVAQGGNRNNASYLAGQIGNCRAQFASKEFQVYFSMQQLIYASRPFGYDASTLAGILSVARTKNALNDITGALICRPDLYLQLLEGPVGKVENLITRIEQDDRHVDVKILVKCRIEDRLFPGWAMKHDPARSWLWTKEEVESGALENASVRDIRSVFLRSANET